MKDPRSLPTLVETLRARAAATPGHQVYRFLADGERRVESLTFAALDLRARAIAAEIQQHGEPRDRVLLLFEPGLDYIAAFLGCLYAGRVAVPAYPPDAGAPERGLARVRAIAEDCDPGVYLTTSAVESTASTMLRVEGPDAAVRWIRTDATDLDQASVWRHPDVDAASLAFLQYTSGSTAAPRGVRLTHANLRANLSAIFERFGHVPGETKGALWLPPYHDMGLIGGILQPAWGGFSATLLSPMAFLRRPARWLEAISRERCDVAGGPNFAYDYCVRKVKAEEKSTLDLTCWRVAFNGAEPVRADTLERFARAFADCGFSRKAFYPCYGLAEATLLVSGPSAAGDPQVDVIDAEALRRGHRRPAGETGARRVVSCGTCGIGELVIADPSTGRRLSEGEVGEIWVSGEHVADGYWRPPSESDGTFAGRVEPTGEGPFLRTGDVGYVHDGQLYVTGRLKDIIIVGGRNHDPHDIEITIEGCHPALRPGSCVAYSIDDGGQEGLAVAAEVRGIGSRDASRTAGPEIAERIRATVSAGHQLRVSRLHLLAPGSIPKTSSGKLQRSACRTALETGTLASIWSDEPGAVDTSAPVTVAGASRELLERLAAALQVAPEALDPGKPLVTYGLDSLALIDLKGFIQERYGVDVPLDVLLGGATLASLGALLGVPTAAPTMSRVTPAAPPVAASPVSAAAAPPTFSLFFFASQRAPRTDDEPIYHLLLESARFADEHGFEAIWTPERHFHRFGGHFPNPGVLGAALAATTRRIGIRAGSVVLPLSSPVRVAEDWAVVDNLSGGRAGVAFASGWNPNDFVIRPEAYAGRRREFEQAIQVVRRLWKREPVALPNGEGQFVDVRTLPSPRQLDIPIWVTAVKDPETFELAGRIGANLLTNLLLYSVDDLGAKIDLYRRARATAGFHPDTGRVTLMLHTFVSDSDARARELVQQPLRRYIEASVELWSGGMAELGRVDPAQRERMIDSALERHYASGMFGSVDRCSAKVEELSRAGVNEIACLVDFGISGDVVLPALHHLDMLRAAVASRSVVKPSPPREPTSWPLTFAQERMWFLQQLEPWSPVYNDLLALRIEGKLDEAQLAQAIDEVVLRHEVLRTVFPAVEGRPVQRVQGAGPVAVERIDLTNVPADARDEALHAAARERAQRPFDLATSPPLRATLARLAETERVLILAIHHIATDAVSARNLLRELTDAYQRIATGASAPPDSALQQREVAVRDRARSEAHAASVGWWKERLTPLPAPLELCADRPRPQLPTRRGIRCPVELEPRTAAALRELAREESATPFTVLLAAYAVVLGRYGGQSRFAIGTPFEGRMEPGTAAAIGSFVNTLALPVNLEGDPPFRSLVHRVRALAVEAQAHASVPFGLVVEALAPERALGRPPVFQVMFSQQRPLPATMERAGLRWSPLDIDPRTAKFDLRLELTDVGATFRGYVEADADLFEEGTVARFAGHFRTAAAALAAAPDRPIGDAELAEAAETAFSNAALCGLDRAYDLERTLDNVVHERCVQSPASVALEWAGGKLTYRELAERVDAWARRLRGAGVERSDIVAVWGHRSPELVVGQLAIMSAGAAFLPLDPSQPRDRAAFVIEDAAPRLILAQPEAMAHLPAGSTRVLPLTLDPPEGSGADLPPDRSPDDIAYVMYTSGSTGRPKGVRIRHRSVVNRLQWSGEDTPLDATDTVLQKTPITFDVSVWDTFAPLVAGARLVIGESGSERDPGALTEAIRRHGVTVMHFVPSMLRAFVEHGDLEGLGLRRVHCSGEVLPVELQNRFFARLPGVGLVNLYGPTEAAVDVTWWTCRPDPAARSVPIGRPAANVRLHLLDERRRPVPAGLPGELHISGVQVAAGYLNRPEADASAFWDDPADGRRYRTGDMARLTPDGLIEYLGRRDDQVKIRGHRIEPGEVEAVLAEHPGVRESAVVLRDLARHEPGLVAYVVFRGDEIPERSLREFLATRLPQAMIPEVFVPLATLPRTGSGKTDRGALPSPSGRTADPDSGFESGTLVREVASLFREVLALGHVGSDDDFFELGGHSLLAAELTARVRAVFGVDLGLRVLFVDPTPRGVAAAIARGLGGETELDPTRLAVDREALAREARLEPTFEVQARATMDGEPADILLTGASGFVGAFLLTELITRTTARIHCLVRAKSPEHGWERIRANLVRNGVWDEMRMPGRIRVVPGDFARDGLGLAPEAYQRLAESVDLVFHNGALVDHQRLYSALRAPNVSGTKELLRLANEGRARAFHYVSTLSVFEAPAYSGIPQVDESDEPEDPLCHDSYAQSKWVAERLVQQAGERGMPVTIHRLAMCTGDSRSGLGGRTGLFAGFLAGVVDLGVAPELSLDTWLTPVDFVARAVVHLSLRHRNGEPGVFHLGCPEPVPYEWLIETLNRVGYRVARTPFGAWRATALAQTTRANPLFPLLPFVTDDLEALYGRGRRPMLGSEATAALLASAGIVCPPLSEDLLARYVEHWRATPSDGVVGSPRTVAGLA